ncbi:hypothetical protein HHX47_DHR9000054 [Lentinula edodes]|nr:hypothetical protein HHX47_DHR9000054 [Lentinula edodes]
MFTFMIASLILAFASSSSSLVAGMAIPIRKSLEDKRSVTVTDFSGGSGDGTYYDAGLGACGITNTDTDYIAAIGEDFFDQYAYVSVVRSIYDMKFILQILDFQYTHGCYVWKSQRKSNLQ